MPNPTRLRSISAPIVALLAALWAGALPAGAQQRPPAGELRGTVREIAGPAVAAATVTVLVPGETTPIRGALTDGLGAFRIPEVPRGSYLLQVTRIGFETRSVPVEIGEGRTEVVVELTPAAIEVAGVSVQGARSRERARFEEAAGVTVQELSAEELRFIPGLAETDPLRAMDVLPGVVSTSDFGASFNVRGGSADQNLILLDGIPIFNPFHLGGFFSVFNGDMVSRAELQSGGFPADQGGRVSSVLSVETDPGIGEFEVDAGVSLLATRVAVAGGVPKDLETALGMSSIRWRGSARRSYLDVVLGPVFDLPYALTDLQGITEFWTRKGGRLTVTGYTGSDRINLTQVDPATFPLRIRWNWGNDIGGARYLHPRRGGGSADFRVGFSRFSTTLGFPDFRDTEFRSQIEQLTLRAEVEGRPSPGGTIRTGVAADRMSYDNLASTGGTEFGGGDGAGWLFGGFAKGEWRRDPWLVEVGGRVDAWVPERGEAGAVVPSPRLAVKRFLGADRDWAARFAIGRYSQFVHSVRDEELPLGLDIWVLAGDRVPRVISDQMQGGIEAVLGERWSLNVEGYHRWFDGVIATNAAEDPNDPLDDLLRGTGRSYGGDLILRRSGDGVSGWISASWLRATRTFEDPFQGVVPAPKLTYAPIFDRRVDLDVVLRLPLPWGIEGGGRFNFGSGIPYTRPLAAYDQLGLRLAEGGRLSWEGAGRPDDEGPPRAVVLGPRNGERYPAYHRLDLSFRKPMQRRWGRITPYLDILNVYNQRNVLFYSFQLDTAPYTRSGVSMFPILPTVGFEASFR